MIKRAHIKVDSVIQVSIVATKMYNTKKTEINANCTVNSVYKTEIKTDCTFGAHSFTK